MSLKTTSLTSSTDRARAHSTSGIDIETRGLSRNRQDPDTPVKADTCRKFATPLILSAWWDNAPHSIVDQRFITDSGIVSVGQGFMPHPPKVVCCSAPLSDSPRPLRPPRYEKKVLFGRFAPRAKPMPNELLEKQVDHGTAKPDIPEVLKVSPVVDHGTIVEIASLFGGPDMFRNAVNQPQTLLYAA